VVNCFEGVEHLASKEMNSCICGKKHIKDNYLIRNKATQEEYIVGSTCARNWFKEDKVKEGCMYCGRMSKNGGNCINCSAKMHLKSVLLIWKRKVVENKEMVLFGKYEGILTYKQLCDDISKKNYVDWCINKSAVDEEVKDRLRYFAEKCKDF
jgi:methionyl-tRNA synthetase